MSWPQGRNLCRDKVEGRILLKPARLKLYRWSFAQIPVCRQRCNVYSGSGSTVKHARSGHIVSLGADAARESILVAAKELFVLGGQSRVGMRDIAKKLGVSPMMPYRHFPSKDHIIMTLRLQAFDDLTARLEAAFTGSADPEQALRAVCSAYFLFASENENSYRLMFDVWEFDKQAEINRDFGPQARREIHSWNANLKAVKAFVQAEGLQIDAELAAHLVWSGLHGLVTLYLARKLAFGASFAQLQGPAIDHIVLGLREASSTIIE